MARDHSLSAARLRRRGRPRAAWRAAVILVPDDQKNNLAEELAAQLGRGNRHVQLSLSRALVALGAESVEPALRRAMASDNPDVHVHANATERLLRNPDTGFGVAVDEAKRTFNLGRERRAGEIQSPSSEE